MDVGRHSYGEITPSGTGCRIWGFADGEPLNRKFTLEIDGKPIAAELFRRTNKALTVTGYTLDPAIKQLANIDKAIAWAVVWGERRKAAAAEAAAPVAGNGFDSDGCRYTIEQIEAMIRNGAPPGSDRSAVFHAIIGHLSGCGWDAERIFEHVGQFPDGIGAKYIAEGRLTAEIARSLGKYQAGELPLFSDGGWVNGLKAKQPEKAPAEEPELEEPQPSKVGVKSCSFIGEEVFTRSFDARVVEPEQNSRVVEPDDDLDEELEDEDLPPADPNLPPLYAHGDPDPRPIKAWLIKHLIPAVGHGLASGQWGTGKTFVMFDLAAALGAGQPFLGHAVKRQCGVLLIAAEGGDEVRLRLDAVVREKCGGMARAPFRWYETAPLLLQKGSVEKLIAMAQQAEASIQDEFGLPLGLIMIDTIAACAGFSRAGEENDNAVGQALMNVLKAVAQTIGCFVLGVDHFGKDLLAGTRGANSKESSGDLVLACLGNKELSGSVTNTRLAVRKHRGGRQGQEYPFSLRVVEASEPDEDGEAITTMVVDWLPAGAVAGAQARPEPDPWLEGCRRDDQRAVMSRFKRVLLTVLAEQGVEQPIPSKVGVKTSDAPIGEEVLTGSFDAPVVRMVDQRIVRQSFDLCTPQDTRQARYERFKAARDRAEHLGLLRAGNVEEITYLWLTRPEPADETEEER